MGKISINKKGIVLIYVMTIGLAVVFLMSALFVAVSVGAGTTKRSAQERQAYLNAKSGAEYAMARIQEELYCNCLPRGNFYVYGEVGSLSYIGQSDFDESPLNGGDYDIFTHCVIDSCHIDDTGSVIDADMVIGIESTGRYASASPYQMKYKTGISVRFNGMLPSFPLDMEERADYTEDTADWYDVSRGTAMLDKNPDITYIKGDAVFPYSTLVHDNGSHNDPYTANQIWFTDDELSLYYNSKNKDITMAANLFTFWGNIEFEDGCTFQIEPCPNDPGEGYAPLITGQTISGYGYDDVIDTDYGLVYFGPGVNCAGVELGGETGRFYFFPKDIDLGALADEEEQSKLLPVTDFEVFNEFEEPVGVAFSSSPSSLSIGGAVQ